MLNPVYNIIESTLNTSIISCTLQSRHILPYFIKNKKLRPDTRIILPDRLKQYKNKKKLI